jgi:hypothetical protein
LPCLLALAQVGNRLGAFCFRHPIGDAAAGAAAIQSEHQPGTLGRAAMDIGQDAERAMRPDDPRRQTLEEIEAGPPHQRAIGEDPKVAAVMFGIACWHRVNVNEA